MLDFVEVAGRIFALVVRASSDDARAFHPYGIADPAGFAAGGCVEGLIHGNDIATGLGLTLQPPADLCARLLKRLFGHYATQLAGTDPWTALRWATGRADLPNAARPDTWRWRATPLSESWLITEPEPPAFVYKGRAQ